MSSRIVILALVGASLGTGWTETKPRVLVERVGSWSTPPAEERPSTAGGRASIFYEDGRFAVVNAVLAKGTQGRKAFFVLGEGYSVFSGCWSASQKNATAVARPVYLPGLINPPPPPMTMRFQLDGSDPLKSRTIRSAERGLHETESASNTDEAVDAAEARTRSFEASSGPTVWSCATH